ncbi:MAG TPA: Dabb family protein [Gammaproteobacteria bacterium]|nr:Dabb family protein [Gammaproteobacteria bacterium]
MTIRHIVLLRFKPSLSKTDIEKIMQTFGGLKNSIPQIMSFSWGENNSPENLHQRYLHGFIMEFKNDLDRKIYLEHPEHIKLAQELIHPAIVEGALPVVFDYVI